MMNKILKLMYSSVMYIMCTLIPDILNLPLIVPYGLGYLATKFIGNIRSIFNMDNTLVIGASYALERHQNGSHPLEKCEYDRITNAIGDPYYTCIGSQEYAPYVNIMGVNVQLWQRHPVLKMNWDHKDFFKDIKCYFAGKKFDKIVIDFSVSKMMISRSPLWTAFIRQHLSQSGVVILPEDCEACIGEPLLNEHITCELNEELTVKMA
ncbi:hypothetical protein [Candidatus Synchoanobacter obligatus]|uniref:Uncharacterized protein n=1 Tax=Candidatus Synchoanobacter obligatus TaxID=2919597 RepID=A0ABT1L528_9GAMM|nr:hypothetical protein [Candidatus Synchoanobacter obligatus]MCP8352021.1 hypothetical protein [Candidatus Synchoanobacter obligatus]